jgi:hypothetical protein
VTLDGSVSSDVNTPPMPLTYSWAQTSGSPVVLSSAAAVTPTFTAPATAGTLGFALTVTNAVGKTTGNVNVNVEAAPIANAGAAQTVASGAVVTLSGIASRDANTPALPLTFMWTVPAGVTLVDPTSAVTTFTAPIVAPGAPSVALDFTLTVNNGVASSSSGVTITVDSPPVVAIVDPAPGSTVGANVRLTANVTDNGTVTVEFLEQVTDPTTGAVTTTSIGVGTGPVGSGPGGSNYTLQTTLAPGNRVIVAQATDLAGNVTAASVTFTVN